MSDKSHVGKAAEVCPVCGQKHHDKILFNTRLQDQFEQGKTYFDGWVLCEEHQQMIDDGYVLFVAVDPEKSTFNAKGNINPEDAYRLGPIIGVKQDAANQIFDANVGPVNFCEAGVIDTLAAMHKEQTDE